MVGNAVSVPVSLWLGKALANPYQSKFAAGARDEVFAFTSPFTHTLAEAATEAAYQVWRTPNSSFCSQSSWIQCVTSSSSRRIGTGRSLATGTCSVDEILTYNPVSCQGDEHLRTGVFRHISCYSLQTMGRRLAEKI